MESGFPFRRGILALAGEYGARDTAAVVSSYFRYNNTFIIPQEPSRLVMHGGPFDIESVAYWRVWCCLEGIRAARGPSEMKPSPHQSRHEFEVDERLEHERGRCGERKRFSSCSLNRRNAVFCTCLLFVSTIWTLSHWSLPRPGYNFIKDGIQRFFHLRIHQPLPTSTLETSASLEYDLPLVPFTIRPLPLGSIKPLGWINDQLNLMSDGLAGRQYEFYHIIKHSPWLGGSSEYSVLNEGFPYWLNGLVPLAYGLNDTRLILQVQDASDYVLNHQQPDGWLGPELVGERDLWARFPLFLGLLQLVEAAPDRACKIIPAMHSFVNLMNTMLISNVGLHEIWGKVRYQDMLIALQWLYENHPAGNQQILLETMHLLHYRGFHWSSWWNNDTFIFADLDTVQPPITDRSPEYAFVHGVNAAQGLKAGAAIYRFKPSDSLLDNNRQGVNWTLTYHGDAAGSIIGDEREAGISANRGSELCTAVEIMYSMSYLYQTLGDNYFADRCELAAFNALPVGITSDHWGHQYLTLASEPHTGQLDSPNPFFNVGDFGIVYGLEPNYPCCTVNTPQGLPKFLSSSFGQFGENGIVHALLGPAQVTTTTLLGTAITVRCNTFYPFGHELSYGITASSHFTLYLRVPSWYVPTNSSLTIGNGDVKYPIVPDVHTGLTPISIPAGTSTVKYSLGATIQVVPRANSTVAIYHGSLLYALDVGQVRTAAAGDLYNITYANGTDPYNTNKLIMPAEVHNYAFMNTKPWNIAIDTSTLSFHRIAKVTDGTELPNPVFEYEAPPTYITAKGCQIDWPLYNGLPGPLPALPKGMNDRNCTGNITDIVL